MLTLVTTPEGPGLQMQHVAPMIYLDHWALRKFADDRETGSRFATALRARGGTLALSWLNLGEFARVSDMRQRRAVQDFVGGVLPAIFCIDVDLAAVDNREAAGDYLPHADRDLVTLFVNVGGPDDKPFTASGLFERVFDPGLAQTHARLAATVQGRFEHLREAYRTDGTFREAVKHAEHPEALAATTRTRAIVRVLAAGLLPDQSREIKPNDAIDFLHAAIPAVYCDVVLLDGGAWDLVERARRRLDEKDLKVAMVFSGRKDGVTRFLAYLEGV